jgi:hypothetical protein
MNAARLLKRAAIVGMLVMSLAAGSLLTQPTTTASASVLPDSHVGAPDIGYPGCPSGCEFEVRPIETTVAEPDAAVADLLPPSGDVGYPRCVCLPS